jgi:membrane protein
VTKVDRRAPLRIRILELLKAAGKEFGQDKASRMSAAIAYRTVFALAPLLLVAVSFAALFLDAPASDCETTTDGECQTVQEQLVGEVAKLSEPLSQTIDDIMTNAREGAATTGLIGTAIFLFTASSLFFEIQGSLNTIFHAPPERTKGIVAVLRGRAIGALAVLLLGAILVVLFAANAVVSGAGSFILGLIQDLGLDGDLVAPLISIAGPLVTLGILIVVFAVQFQTFTVVKIPWKAAWRGGAVTAVVFAAGAIGVGLYFALQTDGGDGTSFSAGGFAGGAVLILFTVFILAQIFLFGAEFTMTYADYVRHGDVMQPSVRAENSRPDITADEVRAAATTDLIARVGVFSFLAGLVLGYFRRP